MKYSEKSCIEFTADTFSKAPVPGGGGVAALVGALGTALGGMVCNLTTGKKKYAQYEDDIQRITKDAQALCDKLINMIDEDAENFLPLSAAYGLPKETEEEKAHKEEVLEKCLKTACSVPIEIVRVAAQAVDLQEELAIKGSKLALSDVGVGAALLRSAILGGWLNVVININMIKDEAFVASVRKELTPLIDEAVKKCDKIYQDVENALNS